MVQAFARYCQYLHEPVLIFLLAPDPPASFQTRFCMRESWSPVPMTMRVSPSFQAGVAGRVGVEVLLPAERSARTRAPSPRAGSIRRWSARLSRSSADHQSPRGGTRCPSAWTTTSRSRRRLRLLQQVGHAFGVDHVGRDNPVGPGVRQSSPSVDWGGPSE